MNLSIGQPTHLALTWNKTNYAIYINSQKRSDGVFSGLTGLNSRIDIGNYGDPAYRTLGFMGNIDDIRTYNRSLTADEIDTLYLTHNIRQGKELAFTVNGVDAQGKAIVYQPESLPKGVTFDPNTQQVRWTPWHNQIGTHTIRFTATGQPEKTVTVEVKPADNEGWYEGLQNITPVIK